MRQDPMLASIGGMLSKFKRAEDWLRKAGLPTFFARVPVWLLCVHYCLMMEGKTRRIARIGERISRWLETITELSHSDKARLELIDMDCSMRNDIESTKRTLLVLRELCVDVGCLFDGIGLRSRILGRTQKAFMEVVDTACMTATTLQQSLEMHDQRALRLLRELQEQEQKQAREQGHAGCMGSRADNAAHEAGQARRRGDLGGGAAPA